MPRNDLWRRRVRLDRDAFLAACAAVVLVAVSASHLRAVALASMHRPLPDSGARRVLMESAETPESSPSLAASLSGAARAAWRAVSSSLGKRYPHTHRHPYQESNSSVVPSAGSARRLLSFETGSGGGGDGPEEVLQGPVVVRPRQVAAHRVAVDAAAIRRAVKKELAQFATVSHAALAAGSVMFGILAMVSAGIAVGAERQSAKVSRKLDKLLRIHEETIYYHFHP